MPMNKTIVLASRPTREAPAGPRNFTMKHDFIADPEAGEVLVHGTDSRLTVT